MQCTDNTKFVFVQNEKLSCISGGAIRDNEDIAVEKVELYDLETHKLCHGQYNCMMNKTVTL